MRPSGARCLVSCICIHLFKNYELNFPKDGIDCYKATKLYEINLIKQALRRRNPGFNERAHGFKSFNDLLKAAEGRGLVNLQADQKSGGYTVQSAD